jgi:hypothetical protein
LPQTGCLQRAAVALGVVAALALSACGDNGESTSEQPTYRPPKPQASGYAHGGRGGSREGSASIALQFPEPKPQATPSAQKAIDAGRKACRGKTPVQVRDEFIAEAEAGGSLNPGQKKMVANIAHYEKQAAGSSDFVAGQLAAGVYEATLPEQVRIFGYQGCVYELAQQLQKEIAQRQNGQ